MPEGRSTMPDDVNERLDMIDDRVAAVNVALTRIAAHLERAGGDGRVGDDIEGDVTPPT